MGLAELLLGKDNAFAQWTGNNQNYLGALGAGIGSGQNIQSGLSNGLQMVPQAKQMDLEANRQREADAKVLAQTNATQAWLAQNHPDLAQMVEAGMPVGEAWNIATQRMSPQGGGNDYPASVQEYEYARQNGYEGSFMDWQTRDKGSGNRPALGTTIYTARDANGNLVPMQAGQGEFVPTQLPDGLTFDPGGMAGAKTTATVDAKTAGAARAALPGAEVSYNNTQRAVAELRTNTKGMNEWFSQIGPRGIYVDPGSPMGQFWAAAEPTNNQAFMQAREALKGGGQITDFEGRKAEDAFSRMRAAMEKGNQDQYLRALADFEEAVALGYAKLRETAQGGYGAGSPAVSGGAPAGNVDDILGKYGL